MPVAPSAPAPQVGTRKKIFGPKVMLLGEPGHGKTDSLRTILAQGMKMFVHFSEPGMEVLIDKRRGKVYTCADGLHWTYTPAAAPSFTELAQAADLINKFSYKQLSEMGGVNKEKYRGFYDLIVAHATCKCDRCGVSFGPVDKLEPYNEWCVVDDSLSAMSIMAMNLMIGSKPAAHQGEYGISMRNLEQFIQKLAFDIPSMMVLMAHIEREGDEVSGGQSNMAATLGRKLAPKLPRPFSDVIHAYRDGTKFAWSTITPQMVLKTRSLPLSRDIPPDFKPLIDRWRDNVKTETEYYDLQAAENDFKKE